MTILNDYTYLLLGIENESLELSSLFSETILGSFCNVLNLVDCLWNGILFRSIGVSVSSIFIGFASSFVSISSFHVSIFELY